MDKSKEHFNPTIFARQEVGRYVYSKAEEAFFTKIFPDLSYSKYSAFSTVLDNIEKEIKE